ncbi:MAG: alpha/beta fold hydrolase [Phycisphaerae bacterium]|nr:alpha/beta fold hydrolase [Phycisphaerae bacterium]
MSIRLVLGGWVLGGLLCLWPARPAWAVEPRPVSFNAADGMRIAADYYSPPVAGRGDAPMVMLFHSYRGDRTAWEPLIAPLHDAGFAILALDLRGHGESATTETRDRVESRDTKLFKDMQQDLRGAYDWLARQPRVDRSRFALVGASVGGSVALQYAAKDRSVDVVVCLSPGLNYLGLDSAGDVGQITGREILLVATEDERDAPYTLKKRTTGVQVKIHKGRKAHGTNMFGVIPELEPEIAKFLKKGVGEPTETTVYGSIKRHIFHLPDSGWLERISPTNMRHYSSPKEAESRGLRASKSKGPRQTRTGRRERGKGK